jgi:hypothetical protein
MINTSSSSGNGSQRGGGSGNKQKRIEKELLALRNLSRDFKIGKKETGLGILLYVITHYSRCCSLRSRGLLSRRLRHWTNLYIASISKYSLGINSLSSHL